MSAIISPCGRYRYRLDRDLGAIAGRGAVAFIMLNPSTADATENDPTIRRCIGFATVLGAARLIVGNLFAWRATDPADLHRAPASDGPIGPDNDRHLLEIAGAADVVIAAWGTAPVARQRARRVAELLSADGVRLQCLRTTKAGAPAHPLYLPGHLRPVPWSPP